MTSWERVTPAAIRAELARLQYEPIDTQAKAGDTWAHPEADPVTGELPAVLVPREEQEGIRGYTETLQSAIERLSWILGTTEESTVEHLTQPGDRFELRLVHEFTTGGRLPVLRAPDVVQGFLGVLRSGARAEFRGTRASYRGTDPDDVNEAMEGIDLLAPAEGSFRLIAISSESTQLPLDPMTATPDKARRTVAAAVRALHAAAETTSAEIPEDVDDLLPAVDAGVSNTLLSGLEDIARDLSGLDIEFSVRWDPTLPPVDVPSNEVYLEREQLARVPTLNSQLKKHEPEEDVSISGWVKTTTADELAQEDQPAGFVIVEIRREKRTRDVRIELPPDEFSKAKSGRSILRATGRLERISGRWNLTEPRNIQIMDTAG